MTYTIEDIQVGDIVYRCNRETQWEVLEIKGDKALCKYLGTEAAGSMLLELDSLTVLVTK